MAYYQYLSELENDSLRLSLEPSLDKTGLNILEEFTTHSNIWAEAINTNENSSSKVKVLISWSDKSLKQFLVEVRSDEPHLKRNTFCERVANNLRELIPPKTLNV